MSVPPFRDRARIDAKEKVRGATVYAGDVQFPGLLYAMTAPAKVAKGAVTGIATAAAMRVPGVVRVLTAEDFPPEPEPAAYPFPPAPPTLEARIAFRGQPVALVLAETLEAAIEGAERVEPSYAPEPFTISIDAPGAVLERGEGMTVGKADDVLADAATILEAAYESPTQHHNPIELPSTVAVWRDGRLVIYEASQSSGAVRAVVARALGLDPAVVEVKSTSVGGGFGQKGWVQRQTALVARAAMLSGRPVKMLMPRAQVFHVSTFRPRSRHRIRLGADASGRMIACRYDAEQQQSRNGHFPSNYHEGAIRLYDIPHYHGGAADIRTDTQAPGHMRAPHEHPACFAMESAVDELAYQLGRDPVAFRMAHDTRVDPHTGRPLSSRFLNECLAQGAVRFGWSRRDPRAGMMTASDGSQVGWGVACGIYPTLVHPAIARLRVSADGSTRFAISGHEMGQGIRTAIAAVLIDQLDINPARLEIVIGDTAAAPQHLTAGSWGTFSVAPPAAKAAAQMRQAVAELLDGREVPGNLHRKLAAVRRPYVEIEVSQLGPGQDAEALDRLRRGHFAIDGPEYPQFTTLSYIAHFVEVRVEPTTRRVRVPRVVSVADCGRVISPRTAASQVRGGVVWGIGHALREATESDPRYGGYLNNDLAEYAVAVNADIGEIDVSFIDKPDPLANALGLKGLGEVAMTGVTPAVVNAIYHATGRRLRELPIRVEHLL